jgi:hypothetical protein
MDIQAIRNEMLTEARNAATKFFQEKLGGKDAYACGFAWVTIFPAHKGNTKAGRVERKVIESLGFKKDWTGKGYEMWNPSGHVCQNVDTKEVGANAAAAVLRKHGFKAYAGSRLD